MPIYEAYHFGEKDHLQFFYEDSFYFPYHLHRSYELLYEKKGTSRITIDGRPFLLEEGEIVLFLPYEVHSIEEEHASTCYVTVFSPDHIQFFTEMAKGKQLKNPIIKLDKSLLEQIEPILFFDASDMLLIRSLLYYLVSHLMKHTELTKASDKNFDLLHKVLVYIGENFKNDITLKSIAAHFGYSHLYLSRYLNTMLGMSFTDFLNQNRINYASHQLRTTDASITDTAYESGYTSIRSFNRNFLKFSGMTPREYKNQFSPN